MDGWVLAKTVPRTDLSYALERASDDRVIG